MDNKRYKGGYSLVFSLTGFLLVASSCLLIVGFSVTDRGKSAGNDTESRENGLWYSLFLIISREYEGREIKISGDGDSIFGEDGDVLLERELSYMIREKLPEMTVSFSVSEAEYEAELFFCQDSFDIFIIPEKLKIGGRESVFTPESILWLSKEGQTTEGENFYVRYKKGKIISKKEAGLENKLE